MQTTTLLSVMGDFTLPEIMVRVSRCSKKAHQAITPLLERKMQDAGGAEGTGEGSGIFACSAAVELALRKAAEHGIIRYAPGAKDFEVVGTPDAKQQEGLSKMRAILAENNGSGVQEIIDWVVYQKLKGIIVYPVEDEHRLSNHKGEVLPDALLVPQGTTALQLAARVHTDLANKFVGAVDVRRKMRVGAEHALADRDVIKISASR